MAFTVRAAHSHDGPAIREVLARSYPVLMRAAYEPDLLDLALPRMIEPHSKLLGSGTYFIAESDGQAVGCGGWSLVAPGTRESIVGVAHLRHFATISDQTERGVGRKIYDRCEIQARAAGIRLFECYSSLNAEPFYAALGFDRIGTLEVPIGPDLRFPSIHMKRSL